MIVIGIAHDPFRDGVPQDRNGDAPPVGRVGLWQGLTQEVKTSLTGVETFSVAKGRGSSPARLFEWDPHGHAGTTGSRCLRCDDDRAVRPGTGLDCIEMPISPGCGRVS